jgi:hypothetical protein
VRELTRYLPRNFVVILTHFVSVWSISPVEIGVQAMGVQAMVVAVGQEAAMSELAVLKHRQQQCLAGMTAPDLQPQR